MVQQSEKEDSPVIEAKESEELPHVEFLTRVAGYPVVQSAFEYASGAYSKAKDVSPTLLKKTLSTAENTVTYAAQFAMPVVQSIEGSGVARSVDQLVCKTLDKVETNLPVIQKSPEEIMNETVTYVNKKITYVNGKMEPVQKVVSSATDLVLNNIFGRLALNTMTYTVSTVHNCVDYIIPPGEEEESKTIEIPAEPSQQIVWSINRSVNDFFNIQHRIANRTDRILNDSTLKCVRIIGLVVDILEWVQMNWKEITTNEFSTNLNNLANYYRDPTGYNEGARRPVNDVEDIIFLFSYLMNRAIQIIRGALAIVINFGESQSLLALQMQLVRTLTYYVDAATRFTRDPLANVDEFIKKDYPTLYESMMDLRKWNGDDSKSKKVKVHDA